jgi:adenosylcobinamide-phosphate synthase
MIDMNEMIIAAAWGLDALLGDPEFLPHPIRAIGRLITALEPPARKSIASARIAGIVVGIMVPLIAFACTFALILAAVLIDIRLGTLVSILLIYTTLSTRSLGQEARAVLQRLETGDIAGARKRLARIVGRDTNKLSQQEIVRATVETVSENTVDGIVSPLFYAFLGGAPLAMAFKAISTLDSMVGYKNERYREFGWFSARLDDVANYIPARLCLLLIPLAALAVTPGRVVKIVRIMLRDGSKSPSPNAGLPESGFAAALGVQLGGPCRYKGVMHEKPLLGSKEKELALADIAKSIRLMWATSILTLLLVCCYSFFR